MKRNILNLGPLTAVEGINSSLGPFQSLPQYQTVYPHRVVQMLGQLYMEYNRAFTPLVEANREWFTDYQYCMYGEGTTPVNFAVQIDMVGLDPAFLASVDAMNDEQLNRALRSRIFEIENSLAMYQLLERILPQAGKPSRFSIRYREMLKQLRARFGKPIALLAVTDDKYQAMLGAEFGKASGERVTDDEVCERTGFDRLFAPDEFRAHVEARNGACDYALYVRSSDPVSKLRKPKVDVEHPLLGDPVMRKVIKANAVTFNIDAPGMQPDVRINDTKAYMAPMGMAFEIGEMADLFTPAFALHLEAKGDYLAFKGERLSDAFRMYLTEHGVHPNHVASGEVPLRAKPAKGTFGCYGHLTGPLPSGKKLRGELRRQIRERGRYVIQPEMTMPQVTNERDGATYAYIDRNFMAFTGVGSEPVFLGGFRTLMPLQTTEAKKGRVHGNQSTVWAEVLSEK